MEMEIGDLTESGLRCVDAGDWRLEIGDWRLVITEAAVMIFLFFKGYWCADGPGSLRRYFNLPRQSLSIRRAAAPHPASWGRSLRTRRCAPQGKHGARCARGLRRILRPPSRLPSSAAPSARAAPMASPAPPPSDKRMSDRTRMSDPVQRT